MFNLTSEQMKKYNALFTTTEIYQQPDVWEDLSVTLEKENKSYQTFIRSIINKHKQTRVIFTGAGTSAFAGDTVIPELNKLNKQDVQFESIPTTDIVSNPEEYLFKDTPTILVSFARSGNSPESVATVELGKQIVDDFYQVVITCNKNGQLAKNVQDDPNSIVVLMPEKSNDKSLAMTSSFSTMVLAAYAIFSGGTFTKESAEVLVSNGRTVVDKVGDIVDDILQYQFERVVYLGSGLLAQLSHEGALKMLELSAGKVVAVHDSSLGFRHGPKSILNDKSLVVLFMSQDKYTRKYDLDILRELAEMDNIKIVALTEKDDVEVKELADWTISVANGDTHINSDFQLGLLYIISAQVLAMKKSIQLGNTPDSPSPDGAINRVVQGVTIYNFSK